MIYQTKVKAIGPLANAFSDSGLLIIFGDNAPDEIREYCYNVDVNPLEGQITPGMMVSFGELQYRVTAIGDEAPKTLAGLGHCTFNFNGATEVELPGTIYLEAKPLPTLEVGTQITIA